MLNRIIYSTSKLHFHSSKRLVSHSRLTFSSKRDNFVPVKQKSFDQESFEFEEEKVPLPWYKKLLGFPLYFTLAFGLALFGYQRIQNSATIQDKYRGVPLEEIGSKIKRVAIKTFSKSEDSTSKKDKGKTKPIAACTASRTSLETTGLSDTNAVFFIIFGGGSQVDRVRENNTATKVCGNLAMQKSDSSSQTMRFTHRSFVWKTLKKLLNPELNPRKIGATGNVSPKLTVPEDIPKPDYAGGKVPQRPYKIDIKSEDEISRMRAAGKLAKHVLSVAKSSLKPGITSDEIDKVVHDEVLKHRAYPSPLNYKSFPKSCCTSVNNVACHGIPDDRPLLSGDIINIDVTVFHQGCHGDTSDTFQIGNVDKEAIRLINTTHDCLYRAINACKPGASFQVIGELIESISKSEGYSVCRDFIGHGIGSYFQGPPNVYHHVTSRISSHTMLPGMTFTIEPILMEGSPQIYVLSDGWTAVSQDGGRSAQAEHTVLITPNGCEILT